MCLGVPGEIMELRENNENEPLIGKVRFGTILKEICLAYVPEAKLGTWVVVHAGFAISILDEEEARLTLALLEEIATFDGCIPKKR